MQSNKNLSTCRNINSTYSMDKDNNAFWKMVGFSVYLGFFTSFDFAWITENPSSEFVKTKALIAFAYFFINNLILMDNTEETYKKDGDNTDH